MKKILILIAFCPYIILGQIDKNQSICDSNIKILNIDTIYTLCNYTTAIEIKDEIIFKENDSIGNSHLDTDFGEQSAVYSESSSELYIGKESGYTLKNKKVGIWEVRKKNKLISHRFYENDTLVLEVFYKRKKIKSIIEYKYVKRYNNINTIGVTFRNKVFFFGSKGKIRYLRHLAPDGVIEEFIPLKK